VGDLFAASICSHSAILYFERTGSVSEHSNGMPARDGLGGCFRVRINSITTIGATLSLLIFPCWFLLPFDSSCFGDAGQ
jgi:hypothetical protein